MFGIVFWSLDHRPSSGIWNCVYMIDFVTVMCLLVSGQWLNVWSDIGLVHWSGGVADQQIPEFANTSLQ